ncbi:hypothetical protein BJF83_22450 [Nocardiopsis sp. CNR-923]|uniref:hypothetical protein n=1 Tax=Nocardiopsis sp. CNR-923 TaxID=1904965 RepID=UPI00095A6022|nr:hypothetical protein [Nocardiopsis sp. CNR-923]OLT25845.1 hypothetical protein BJF83_22450 [Nocardiopsis sp. CNR-923]
MSGTELVAWLRQGHDTTQSLYAVLSKRLASDYLVDALPAWVRHGGTSTPSLPPRPERAAQDEPDPSQAPQGAPRVRRCARHGTPMVADRSGHGWACSECVAEPHGPPARPRVPVIDLLALPDPDPPEHCGAFECHPDRRHLLRWDPVIGQHVDLGPCPRCHPSHSGEGVT